MQNSQNFLNRIKLKIKIKDYFNANKMLRDEIKKIFIYKIKEKQQDYSYTSMIDLLYCVEKYLTNKEKKIFQVFDMIINEENIEEYELDCLLDVYAKLIENN